MQNSRCFNCANYLGDLTCLAFQKGIPEQVLTGESEHKEPLKGQENEIVFEPAED